MPEARRLLPFAGLTFVAGAVIFLGLLPQSVQIDIGPLLRNVGSGLFLMAGVLQMAVWRLTRDRYSAILALLFLLVGTTLPSASVFNLLVHDGPIVQLEAPETRTIMLVPLIALALLAARSGAGSARTTMTIMGAVIVAGAALVVVGGSPALSDRQLAAWLALEIVIASLWTALAVQARSRRLAGHSCPTWMCAALGLMAFSEALKGWSLASSHAPHGVSVGMQLLAAAVALLGAAHDLGTSFGHASSETSTLTRALVDTQQRLDTIEELQRRRLHDARSAVIGVVGASHLLAEPGCLGTVDTDRLRTMVTAELSRLQGLLCIDDDEAVDEFDVARAIAGVVESHRLTGQRIDVRVGSVRALGRARATATVVDNLLCNAERHAPGARVTITAVAEADHVTITVSDDGPGIPTAELSHVLRAGARGSTARGEGSGLGLFSAEQAMRAQSGSLQVEPNTGGGTAVSLEMPAPCLAVAS
ncbi:MAG TPA: HAMP domain-containing sensor histidine kinase [Jatrophihabitantaceae bacterium]